MTDIIDHEAQARSRIYGQYRNKFKAVEWLTISGGLGNQIEDVYQDIRGSYNIDSANSDELDILGRIIGINRSFSSQFTYDTDQFGRTQFGRGQYAPARGFTDEEFENDIFRVLLRAKIAKNNSDATLDGIVSAVSFIVETDDIQVDDQENMAFGLIFDSLTDTERIVLSNFDVIPEPQGVRYIGYVEQGAIDNFGSTQFGRGRFAFFSGA